MTVDTEKLNAFVEHVTYDLSAGYIGVMVSLGHKLGLYKALAGAGPLTAETLAAKANCDPRYTREWLNSQVSAEYLQYDKASRTFLMTPEQAVVLAEESSPCFIPLAWNTPASMWLDEEKTLAAFRNHEGVSWAEHHERLFCGVAAFYRNAYQANLVQHWLPSLDGVTERLEAGIRVADIGCGHGHTAIIMAQAYPKSEFFGFDVHEESIEAALRNAKAAGVDDRVHFEVSTAKEIPDRHYGLVCYFDCLHDMGDPVGALRRTRSIIDEEASVLLIEPFAEDNLEDNINPVARMYYAASTTLCCAHSKSEEVGLALGAQAGYSKLKQILFDGGFHYLQKTADSAFNMVLQARIC